MVMTLLDYAEPTELPKNKVKELTSLGIHSVPGAIANDKHPHLIPTTTRCFTDKKSGDQ